MFGKLEDRLSSGHIQILSILSDLPNGGWALSKRRPTHALRRPASKTASLAPAKTTASEPATLGASKTASAG